MIQHDGFTDRELGCFRRWQATSYAVLAEVRAALEPGMSERDATRLAMKAYRREGVQRYFHLPVALFGARTALPEPWTTESLFPGRPAAGTTGRRRSTGRRPGCGRWSRISAAGTSG